MIVVNDKPQSSIAEHLIGDVVRRSHTVGGVDDGQDDGDDKHDQYDDNTDADTCPLIASIHSHTCAAADRPSSRRFADTLTTDTMYIAAARFTKYLTIYRKISSSFIIRSTYDSDLHRAKISPRNIVR